MATEAAPASARAGTYARQESFSPVGRPRARPAWRAGRDGDAPDLRAGALETRGRAAAPPAERDPLARRITCLHLPRLSVERWQRCLERLGEPLPDDLPAALAVDGPHGPVIHATTRAAEQAGVRRGARVVDMRALCPDLRVEHADTQGDRMALQRLMLWCRRWCPWTAVSGEDRIVMDTTGSDHLHGGEAAMLRAIEEALSHLGLSADLATAPTQGAAWALAQLGGVRETLAPGTLAARMAPFPVRALRLEGETVLTLQRLGLKTVGDLAVVPRLSLARRFSREAPWRNPLLRLDQMLGRSPEPVEAPDDPPRFAVETRLAEPVEDPTPHLPALAEALCAGLAEAGFGARRVRLTVYRTDGEVSSVEVALARPSRDFRHISRLFDGKLERIDPGYGFDLVTLGAVHAEDLSEVQTRLDGAAEDGAELARLTDRLTARFGPAVVRRAALRESHVPERREDWHGAPDAPWPSRPGTGPARPMRLLAPAEEIRVLYAVPEGPPAQFVWRRLTCRVVRFAGPERIAPEWWRDRPGTRLRDYYHVEDHAGRRIWLYRDGVLDDGRGETPRWFVHGVSE
ncbi:DNA polymerase Y family protein [Histidinibacterium lentulum]|uniref:DNA-directed DNA polymerase n=2 Tax=Histidinibacterium lentulum TaxID=2480588 RepID=A0A3N2QZ65_9RHOB|nr:DNA polymerase Y family protein [Histidinibacterium lentulum]